ncbi:MAG: beta-hydroxyacyl-ACP dehydratase [Rhizobiales bacterium]|nr:beta-hydroxyacyl-ACP dehydratase [Hyphomicrobiales bacterium]
MRLAYFQMIDTISTLDCENGLVEAIANVPSESTIFEGHFPGMPLLPGVLLIETMAQASGYLLLASRKFEAMPFLAAVKDVKLRTFVEPNTKLTVTATLEHAGSGFDVTKAEIKSDGKRICNAQLTFRSMPFPEESLKQEMLSRFDEIYPAGLPS